MKSKSFIILTILTVFLLSTLFADASTSKSPFIDKTYTHSPLNEGEVIYDGIDVSTWQEQIDWKKVKNSGKVDFAFIRMGYRGNTNGNLYRDSWFKRNMEGAIANRIPVGVYFYTTALDQKEAKEEAKYLIDNVKEYDVDLPLVIDFEFNKGYRNVKLKKKSKTYNTNLVSAFCKTVKDAGYKPMVYANKSDFENHLYPKELKNKGYLLWLAQYNVKPTLGKKGENTIKIDCWQYRSTGTKVSGVDGEVDCNFFYDDGTFFPCKVGELKKEGSNTDSIKLSWKRLPGAANYNILRSTTYGGKYKKIGESTTTSYTDSGLKEGREYYYKVKADLPKVDESEKLAAYTTNKVSRIIKTKSALNMRAHAGTGYNRLLTIPKGEVTTVYATVVAGNQTWYKVTYKNKTGYVSGGYCTLYTVMKTSEETNLYNEANMESEVLDTVGTGKLVRVRSTDEETNMCKVTFGKGVSYKTGWVNRDALVKAGTYKPLTKVKGLKRSSFEKNYVTIKWNKVTGANKYAVYRAKAYNGKYKRLGYTSKTSFKNTSVVKGTTYYYRVYPINQFETGPASDKLTAWSKKGTADKGVTKRKVPMRLHAGTQFKKLKTIPKNYKVNVSSYTLDSRGNRWYKVTYQKKTGYVIGNSVRLNK